MAALGALIGLLPSRKSRYFPRIHLMQGYATFTLSLYYGLLIVEWHKIVLSSLTCIQYSNVLGASNVIFGGQNIRGSAIFSQFVVNYFRGCCLHCEVKVGKVASFVGKIFELQCSTTNIFPHEIYPLYIRLTVLIPCCRWGWGIGMETWEWDPQGKCQVPVQYQDSSDLSVWNRKMIQDRRRF